LIAIDAITQSEQPMVATTGTIVAALPKVDQLGAIYASISIFQFNRPSTNEVFMINLCSICDK